MTRGRIVSARGRRRVHTALLELGRAAVGVREANV